MNNISIVGNLTRNLDSRAAGDHTVYSSTVAVSTGKDKTAFLEFELWNSKGSWAFENLGKGDRVAVAGSMKQDTWKDKTTGENRSKLFISAFSIDGWPRGNKTGSSDGYESTTGEATEILEPQDAVPEATTEDIPFQKVINASKNSRYKPSLKII